MIQHRKFDFDQGLSVSQMQRIKLCQLCCSQSNPALLFSTSTIFDEVIGDIGVLAKQGLICWKQFSSNFHACLLSKLRDTLQCIKSSMCAVKWSKMIKTYPNTPKNTPCFRACLSNTTAFGSTICYNLLLETAGNALTQWIRWFWSTQQGLEELGVATLDPLWSSFQAFNLKIS